MARRALSTSLLLLLSSDRAAAGATEAEADLQRTGMNATGHIVVSNDDSTALLDERGQAVGTGSDEATVVGMNATGIIRTGGGDDRYSVMETAAEVEGAKKAKKELQARAKTGGKVSQREGASSRLESATFGKSKEKEADSSKRNIKTDQTKVAEKKKKEMETEKLLQSADELNKLADKLMSHVDHTNFDAIAKLRKLKATVLSKQREECLKIEDEARKNKDEEDPTLKHLKEPCASAAKLMQEIQKNFDVLISRQEAIGKQMNEAQNKECDFAKCKLALKEAEKSDDKTVENANQASQTLKAELIAQAEKDREQAEKHGEQVLAMNSEEYVHDQKVLNEHHKKADKQIEASKELIKKAEAATEKRKAGETNASVAEKKK